MKQVSLSFSMFLNKDGFMYKFFDLLLSKLDFIMPIGLAIDLSMLQWKAMERKDAFNLKSNKQMYFNCIPSLASPCLHLSTFVPEIIIH